MIQAIDHMKLPVNKETMRSFLGMVNDLNIYSALCAPPNAFTQQTTDYKPTKEHFKLFDQFKLNRKFA